MKAHLSEQVEIILRNQVAALKAHDDAAYRNHVHEMNTLAIDIAGRVDRLIEDLEEIV